MYYDTLDAMGHVLHHSVHDQDKFQLYTHTYEKRDGYLETNQHGERSDNTRPQSDTVSTYNVNGHLAKISETQWPAGSQGRPYDPGIPDTVSPDGTVIPGIPATPAELPGEPLVRLFVNDAHGVILRKFQQGHTLKQLIVNNQVITAYGSGTDPNQEINPDGSPHYIDQGTFGATYQKIDNKNAVGNSRYTVQQGDTLQFLAQGMWGDANLWYRIADANGLSGLSPDSELKPGTVLTLPSQTGGLHNKSSTYKPYDPSEIVGDTTPQMPAPAAKEKCGGWGKTIVTIVAIVVAALVVYYSGDINTGYAIFDAIVVAGAAAAAGSVASQLVAMAIGIQDGFNWKALAISVVGAVVTAGVGGGGGAGASASFATVATAAASAAVGNAITQGILVLTGLQDKFDWRGVAAAAVGGAVGNAVGGAANSLGASSTVNAGIAGAASSLATGYASARFHHQKIDGMDLALCHLPPQSGHPDSGVIRPVRGLGRGWRFRRNQASAFSP